MDRVLASLPCESHLVMPPFCEYTTSCLTELWLSAVLSTSWMAQDGTRADLIEKTRSACLLEAEAFVFGVRYEVFLRPNLPAYSNLCRSTAAKSLETEQM